MDNSGFDKLTVLGIALLFSILFVGELSAMMAIASHECQDASCIESAQPE